VLSEEGIGLAGGSTGEEALLERSTDFGRSWLQSQNPASQVLKTFDWIDGTNEVWGVTSQSGLYQSFNGGLDWTQHVPTPPFEFVAEDVAFANGHTGWCVGWNPSDGHGQIFKYSSSAGIAEQSLISGRLVVQAYPNPFTTDIWFAWEPAGMAPVEILIYDVTGRKIWTAEGIAGEGSTRCRWEGRNESGGAVARGIYLYRITMGGRLTTGTAIKSR
jgi:hypothetical protein